MMQDIILKCKAEGCASKNKHFWCSKKRKVGKIHVKETITCKSNVTICAMLNRKVFPCCEDAILLILLFQ